MKFFNIVCILVASIFYWSSATPDRNQNMVKLHAPQGDSSGWSTLEAKLRRSPRDTGDIYLPTSLNGKPGEKGEKGERGARGKSGIQGERGETSEKGEPGATGKQGDTGPPGPTGVPGTPGETGQPGRQGDLGISGAKGEKGDTGEQGKTGESGTPGVQGQVGTPGAEGPRGYRGASGVKGQQGNPGEQGKTGPKGEFGKQGERGQQGLKGSIGYPGAEGMPGPPGISSGIRMLKLSHEQCSSTCSRSETKQLIGSADSKQESGFEAPSSSDDLMSDHELYCSMCGLQTSARKCDGLTENLMKKVATLEKLTLKLVACRDFDPECVKIENVDGKVYLLGQKAYNWMEAEKICAAVGMRHFVPETTDVYKRVFSFIDHHYSTDSEYWIGAKDRDNNGHFVWADGKNVEFGLWGTGEPRRLGKTADRVELCVAHSTKQNSWKAEDCNGKRLKFICS